MARPGAGERGFALLIVLWTLVMVSLLVTAITAAGRGRLRQAADLRRNAQLDAEAAGGVQEAVFHLLDGGRNHWPADGSTHQVGAAGSRLALRIDSETGRVNPNRAAPELLDGLLQAVGADSRQAAAIATAIVAWRTPGVGQDGNAPAGAGGFRPPGAPFESIAELGLVDGMTPALLAALEPHLSLYRSGDPDLPSADPVVLQAIELAAGPGAAAQEAPPGQPPPRRDESLVAVTATATDGAGHRAACRAIVLTGVGETEDHRPFRIMQWNP